ncbi:hypothetical protein ABID21_000698 [Pseudorhizobium tarimense]|uniref:Transposase n=1 Tax=Pseudorhizobium tarimense TaxID=1079109 RepID=A0ABV2H257_9HYPH|nr:hypothetical protein [Pseudorhizobium tarimense]MCJ8517787.1 hypothetical protein [Pseudorhizobium tarimense]
MLKATHFAVQISSKVWLVTFVSELGETETRRMTSDEFIEMIRAEARLAD